jgi:hypothetical protein
MHGLRIRNFQCIWSIRMYHCLPSWKLLIYRIIRLLGLRSWNVQPVEREHLLDRMHGLRIRNFQCIWSIRMYHRLPSWNVLIYRIIRLLGLRSWNVQPVDREHLLDRLHGVLIWNVQPVDRKHLFDRLHGLRSWNLQQCWPIRLHGLPSWFVHVDNWTIFMLAILQRRRL